MPLSSQNSLARRCGSARTGAQATAATMAAAASDRMARERPVAAAPTPRRINAIMAPSLGALKTAAKTHPADDPQTDGMIEETTKRKGQQDAHMRHAFTITTPRRIDPPPKSSSSLGRTGLRRIGPRLTGPRRAVAELGLGERGQVELSSALGELSQALGPGLGARPWG